MEAGNILVLDDDEDILTTAELFLTQYYDNVITDTNPGNLTSLLNEEMIDIILLDMNFRKGDNEGDDGFRILREIKNHKPETVVIFMTACGDIDLAVRSLKEGAMDFITKPWQNEKLLTTVQTAIQLAARQKQIDLLKNVNQSQLKDQNQTLENFIGESLPFKRVKETINKVAPTDASILLLGNNGTGKGMAARTIHIKSARSERPFISIDLGAVSETLLESELFGHEKGAFTDAKSTKPGRLEMAHQGTLFLDEIGNLSLTSQAKLLTVLQNRSVRRVGSNHERQIDVRLICATNMPLYQMVQEGSFRQDLLYRINTVELRLPDLSERIDDLDMLLKNFIDYYKRKYDKSGLRIKSGEVKKLKSYHWPGNIRELEHATERAVILCDLDELQATDFGVSSDKGHVAADLKENLNLKEMEIRNIKKALIKHNGNITKSARELGIDRLALYRRLEKYGI